MTFTKSSKWLLGLSLVLPLTLLALAWKAGKRRPHLFMGIASPAVAIALSHDGSEIVCASDNGVVQKWRPERARFNSFHTRGDLVSSYVNGGYDGSNSAPVELRFSPDERWMAVAKAGEYQPRGPVAWVLADRSEKWSLAPQFNHKGPAPGTGADAMPATHFALSADAHFVACAGEDWTRILDLTRPKPYVRAKTNAPLPKSATLVADFTSVAQLPSGAVTMAFSPDAKRLAMVGGSGRLAVWDIATLAETLLPPKPTISNLAFSPDGRYLAVLSSDQSLALYDFVDKKWTYAAAATPAPGMGFSTIGGMTPLGSVHVPTLAWMPDSRSLWVGGDAVQQFSAPELKPLRTLPVGGPVAVSGNGRVVATRSIPRQGEPAGIWEWEVG